MGPGTILVFGCMTLLPRLQCWNRVALGLRVDYGLIMSVSLSSSPASRDAGRDAGTDRVRELSLPAQNWKRPTSLGGLRTSRKTLYWFQVATEGGFFRRTREKLSDSLRCGDFSGATSGNSSKLQLAAILAALLSSHGQSGRNTHLGRRKHE